MKRLVTAAFVLAIFVVTSAVSSPWAGSAGTTAVTGAGSGVFPSGAEFDGVKLNTSTFGNGVVIYPDGSATGDFFTILAGTSLNGLVNGAAQFITVTGRAASGTFNSDGSATFGGLSTVDMGDGSGLLTLPFSVTATAQSLTLVLGTTVLPTQSLTSGGVDIEPF